MSILPRAELSPRIENDIIFWYQGDTFQLTLEICLEDQEGEETEIPAEATVAVVFRDEREKEIKAFSFTGIENNTVELDFDGECSALFPKGEYRYRVLYTAGERTTLAADNLCVVE